ncbi:MAG TPA: hypothetical protein VEW25_12680, partial [Allosphingosinicella sp.]|nr:hypothetical protein [Allosphingosinicella sp.]
YEFGREDWKSPAPPESGASVDFVPSGDRATEIYVVRRAATQSAAAPAPPSAKAGAYFKRRPAMILGLVMLAGCLLPFLSVPFFSMTLFSLPSTFSFFVNLAGAFGANTQPGMGGARAAAWSLYLLYTIPAAAGWLIFREVGGTATRRLSLAVGLIGLAMPFVTAIVSTLIVRASAPVQGARRPDIPNPADAVLQMLSHIGIGWMLIILASIGLVALGSGWSPFGPAARRD